MQRTQDRSASKLWWPLDKRTATALRCTTRAAPVTTVPRTRLSGRADAGFACPPFLCTCVTALLALRAQFQPSSRPWACLTHLAASSASCRLDVSGLTGTRMRSACARLSSTCSGADTSNCTPNAATMQRLALSAAWRLRLALASTGRYRTHKVAIAGVIHEFLCFPHE